MNKVLHPSERQAAITLYAMFRGQCSGIGYMAFLCFKKIPIISSENPCFSVNVFNFFQISENHRIKKSFLVLKTRKIQQKDDKMENISLIMRTVEDIFKNT